MNRVVAMVPAHNEQDVIADAIVALMGQSRPPDRLIVISDNSTDDTVAIARSFGSSVECIETVGNRHMKAGALNQVLAGLDEPDDTYVVIVDADTRLNSRWIDEALQAMADPTVGAVGGIFLGDGQNGLLGDLQGLEYARYRRFIRRDHARARVLTGTSTMARIGTYRQVRDRRASGEFPGSGFYNVNALVEDFEFTVCVKRMGLQTISPDTCTVVTETMPTVPMLWRQRIRWQRGAMDVLVMHRINRVTAPYMARQAEAGMGIMVNLILIVITVWALAIGQFQIIPFWLAVGGLFYAERLVSGREYGRKGAMIAATVVADMAFDLMIGAVWIWSLWLTVSNSARGWGHASIDDALAKE